MIRKSTHVPQELRLLTMLYIGHLLMKREELQQQHIFKAINDKKMGIKRQKITETAEQASVLIDEFQTINQLNRRIENILRPRSECLNTVNRFI